MIDKEDLKAVFREFQLDVKEAVVDQLLAYCDADKDGLLSFTEFANFLNWKDLMPLHSQKLRGQRKGQWAARLLTDPGWMEANRSVCPFKCGQKRRMLGSWKTGNMAKNEMRQVLKIIIIIIIFVFNLKINKNKIELMVYVNSAHLDFVNF